MLLIGVREENGWLSARWNLTYPVGWQHICKAVATMYDFNKNPEVLVDGNAVEVSDKQDILNIEEGGDMVIRGYSTIVNCPLMITFYNQTQAVDVTVPCMAGEFSEADYQKFNLALGQYMDSIELAMYR